MGGVGEGWVRGGSSGALGPDSMLLKFWLLAREVFFSTIKQTLHGLHDVIKWGRKAGDRRRQDGTDLSATGGWAHGLMASHHMDTYARLPTVRGHSGLSVPLSSLRLCVVKVCTFPGWLQRGGSSESNVC